MSNDKNTIGKNYLFVKDHFEIKYQYLTIQREVSERYLDDPNTFVTYSSNLDYNLKQFIYYIVNKKVFLIKTLDRKNDSQNAKYSLDKTVAIISSEAPYTLGKYENFTGRDIATSSHDFFIQHKINFSEQTIDKQGKKNSYSH